MKKILALTATLLLLSTSSLAQERPAHFVSWGDEEGIIKRSGDFEGQKNEAMPVLKQRLNELEKKHPIDAILHTGDFVRFDPNEKLYIDFLGDFLNRFYPTTGGDQEFSLGRYYMFLTSVPHLKFLYLDRVAEDRNGLEYYYHAVVKNTHVISLYNPDEYREHDKKPQFKWNDIFTNSDNAQYKWLEGLLKRIRTESKDTRPIVVLTHRPVFNNSKLLVEMFDKYKVNLVLSGDVHVLGTKKYKDTTYIVTGMMGDRYLGGCEYLEQKETQADGKNIPNINYIEPYDNCSPKGQVTREKGKAFKFHNDHYIDILIGKDFLEYKAIDIETGREIRL